MVLIFAPVSGVWAGCWACSGFLSSFLFSSSPIVLKIGWISGWEITGAITAKPVTDPIIDVNSVKPFAKSSLIFSFVNLFPSLRFLLISYNLAAFSVSFIL